jgi:hypothetical protein
MLSLEEISEEYNKNYFGGKAKIFSYENGELIAKTRHVLLPKFKGLQVLIESENGFTGVDRDKTRINSVDLKWRGNPTELLEKAQVESFKSNLVFLNKAVKYYPVMESDANLGENLNDSKYSEMHRKINEKGGAVGVKFADSEKIFLFSPAGYKKRQIFGLLWCGSMFNDGDTNDSEF